MDNIEISVYCLAYNCVEFIEKSICGMVNQNIKVKYKIIIHDDASTDGTTDIIKKFADRYPEKIQAIFQTENQYSRGIDIYKKYIEPNIEGKYIAICEGDDMWSDENKLQLQYDYMENHSECSLCTHNTIWHDLNTGKDKKLNKWNKIHILTEQDIFIDYCVHTSSYFFRRSEERWPGKSYWFGDFMMLTWAFYLGNIVCLPRLMSVYNRGSINGVMSNLAKLNVSNWIERRRDEITYINEYNQITKYKYNEYANEHILLVDFECVQRECEYIILTSGSKADSIDSAKRICSHKWYKEFINRKKGIFQIIRRYKYEGHFFYPLWKFLMRKSIKHRL